jgi:hypothetical protein
MSDNPDIDAMFPQVKLGASDPQPEEPPVSEPDKYTPPVPTQTEMASQLQASFEVSLACAMARVAFLAAANEAEDPKAFVNETISTWVKSQKAKMHGMSKELQFEAWQILDRYAEDQEQRMLQILVG